MSAPDFLRDELESHSCPVCYEMMNNPTLCMPCGHSFCKECLATSLKATGKNLCPLCRCVVKSQALNYSLQALIQSLVRKREELSRAPASTGLHGGPPPSAEEEADRWIAEYRSFDARCRLLSSKSAELKDAFAEAEREKIEVESTCRVLEEREEALRGRIRELEAELDRVATQRSVERARLERAGERLERTEAALKTVTATLAPLERERDRARFLLKSRGIDAAANG